MNMRGEEDVKKKKIKSGLRAEHSASSLPYGKV